MRGIALEIHQTLLITLVKVGLAKISGTTIYTYFFSLLDKSTSSFVSFNNVECTIGINVLTNYNSKTNVFYLLNNITK